ncbi:DsbA family protein [Streptosporangium sp. NPDC001559]|uniref:DsbA family protein n=1 Tax=Streptosporangium sp. NPDC001559 TaxID=3366187 RepID=UPI0036EB8242
MKRIEVWADMVCTWAHVGRQRLVSAGLGEDVEVVWRPYQLDPTAPGPRDETPRDPATPTEEAPRGPIWGAVPQPNTFDAHRVIAIAYERGGSALQGAVVERILRAHFTDGSDIGDRAVLADLAAEAGLDGVAEALAAGEGTEQVRYQLLRGKAIGIGTSPTFVVGDQAVAGAQSPEVLRDLVRHAVPGRDLPEEVTRLRHAESLLDARDPLGALEMLRPLLEDHGDDPAVGLLAARAYFGSAQLGRALRTLESLVERAPGDHYARFLLGRTLERSNRPGEALPHLHLAAAMSSDPAYADAVRRVERRGAA